MISDFLLFISSSLFFSITILCFILILRVSDRFLKGFISILIPLLIQTILILVNTYINRTNLISTIDYGVYSAFALFGTFCSIICSALVLLFVSRYLIDLIPIPARKKKIGNKITLYITLIYLLICLFSVFFVNTGEWVSAFDMVLNELFVYGSLILVIHGLFALLYLKQAKNVEEESLLRDIAIAFLPIFVFFFLDLFFLKEMTFKTTYISYTIFSIEIYLFVSRNYFRKYELDPSNIDYTIKLNSFGDVVTKREQEILILLIQGKTNKEIGDELCISVNTVKTHIKNIYFKMDVTNRIQLIQKINENHHHPQG